MSDTDTKIALVTGASRGLGFATALELGKAGYHVVALARTVGGLESLADQIEAANGSVTLVPLDVTDEGGLQRLGKAIFDRWGKLDLLVHCAAHGAPLSPLGHAAEKDLDKCLAINAKATQRIITMMDPLLRAASGHAIFMDDPHEGEKFFSTYAASKAAARVFVSAYAAEKVGQSQPVKVTLHTPAPMPTGLRARFYPGQEKTGMATPAEEAAKIIKLL